MSNESLLLTLNEDMKQLPYPIKYDSSEHNREHDNHQTAMSSNNRR